MEADCELKPKLKVNLRCFGSAATTLSSSFLEMRPRGMSMGNAMGACNQRYLFKTMVLNMFFYFRLNLLLTYLFLNNLNLFKTTSLN